MTPETRANSLRALGEDKRRLAIPTERLHALDRFLEKVFGIRQIPDGCDWWASLEATCGMKIAREYRKRHDQLARHYAAGRKPPLALERAFYDLIARDPLFGLVHSQKRASILDTGALLTHVTEVCGISGRTLDVGCNGGYHALWLALQGTCAVIGVDMSRDSIEYARRVSTERIEQPVAVDFRVASFPANLEPPFDLVYSSTGGVDVDNTEAMRRAAELLADGGVLVVVQNGPMNWVSALVAAQRLGLGIAYLDVVGGWNGIEFGAELVFIFVKGFSGSVPKDPQEEAQSAWSGFRDYANSGVDPSLKNQAYYRATAGHRAIT